MIEAKNLTLRYKSGKGIFHIDFSVRKGQVMGYLGPNGSGKTTTIRALLGFMKADGGSAAIDGLDSYSQAPEIMKRLGYLPGEISFPDNMKGADFLKYVCQVRGIKEAARMESLLERFELDAKGEIKKYSKGMKQKLGIVTAFMHDPDILILDEPTSGLDPLMQNVFIELILEEKKRGKTILMSSHSFEETERTCDDVLIIKEGRLVAKTGIKELKSHQRKAFIVKTDMESELLALGFETGQRTDGGTEVFVKGQDIDAFIKKLGKINVIGFEQKQQSLEDIFLNFYGKEASK